MAFSFLQLPLALPLSRQDPKDSRPYSDKSCNWRDQGELVKTDHELMALRSPHRGPEGHGETSLAFAMDSRSVPLQDRNRFKDCAPREETLSSEAS